MAAPVPEIIDRSLYVIPCHEQLKGFEKDNSGVWLFRE
jgi:hypothetical protein